MRKSPGRFRFVLDINVLFSAIRYRGKPFELLEEAEKKGVEVIIPEYVYDELREVFERNGIRLYAGQEFPRHLHQYHNSQTEIWRRAR
ncbi:PIN domain-containing protein [Archaeoglobus neptunius]|uniref:hypothetical protein n=1 Tax=Archaeoglobus neptunius TaxID=2798580 RepID=UPI0019274472|nr:hypothetical protein [Archaeoglobus neptunius]